MNLTYEADSLPLFPQGSLDTPKLLSFVDTKTGQGCELIHVNENLGG